MTPFSYMHFPMVQILVLQVSSSDTLASIAAKFDTTTSELMKLNKLMSQMIFPGQVQHLVILTVVVTRGNAQGVYIGYREVLGGGHLHECSVTVVY